MRSLTCTGKRTRKLPPFPTREEPSKRRGKKNSHGAIKTKCLSVLIRMRYKLGRDETNEEQQDPRERNIRRK